MKLVNEIMKHTIESVKNMWKCKDVPRKLLIGKIKKFRIKAMSKVDKREDI